MLRLQNFSTVSYDEQNACEGIGGEGTSIVCWCWPAVFGDTHVIVKIDGFALEAISGLQVAINSGQARKALLGCQEQIEKAASRKYRTGDFEVALKRHDFVVH